MRRSARELEIYVHIPFCIKKCAYCDFLSAPASMETMRAYVDALKREIRNFPLELAGLNQTADYSVRSVFFGGGTPSILPADWIGEILDDLKEKFAGHLVVSSANE